MPKKNEDGIVRTKTSLTLDAEVLEKVRSDLKYGDEMNRWFESAARLKLASKGHTIDESTIKRYEARIANDMLERVEELAQQIVAVVRFERSSTVDRRNGETSREGTGESQKNAGGARKAKKAAS